MKVKELIEALQKQDQDEEVFVQKDSQIDKGYNITFIYSQGVFYKNKLRSFCVISFNNKIKKL